MDTIVSTTLSRGEIPPARTPFKIQDPYTGRFVWNQNDDLHLLGNGEGEELLWELEHAPTVNTGEGYLLKNVLTGKVIVDESVGDGRLSRGFGVKAVADSAVDESQIWTMRPLECEEGTGGQERLFCIQNQRNRAFIVNGLVARGKKQLRTRVTNEESKSRAWRFILVSDLYTGLKVLSETPDDSGTPSTSSPHPPEIHSIVLRRIRKRSRSGNYKERPTELPGSFSSIEQKGEGDLHDRDLYWKRMPPVPEDCDEDAYVVGRKISRLATGRRSNWTTAGDLNLLQEEVDASSWMTQPHWKRWISAVSDFDISWITPKIGTCTRTTLKEKGFFRGDGNDLDLLTVNEHDSPWYFQPKLEETL